MAQSRKKVKLSDAELIGKMTHIVKVNVNNLQYPRHSQVIGGYEQKQTKYGERKRYVQGLNWWYVPAEDINTYK